MRLLQIESDAAIAQSVELMLKAEGFKVYTTDLGEEGIDLAKIYDYDAVLCELALSDMSGLDVLRAIRAAKIGSPVLMLTGMREVELEVASFAAGADELVRKPFHRDVLVARLNAVIRRARGHARSLIEIGELTIDLDQKTAAVAGARVHLTGREYQILELLAVRKGAMVTKEMFLNHLYGGMDEPELKIIDVFICKIRNKLRPLGVNAHLETVWGRGYRLTETPSELNRPGGYVTAPSPLQDAILSRLKAGPATVRDLGDLSQSLEPERAVQAAITTLRARGLLDRSQDGRVFTYWLREPAAA